ncbi:MAG: glycosyltransferase family 2 protein [Patescibacteria group bacterium]|nr:glycosyltransferase family 2 protein [Patescibacteria group bacterium]
MKLSIIVPVYNEKITILEILRRIGNVNLEGIEKEIVIVDDGSTDGTREILKNLENKYTIIYHQKNRGKGAAIRSGVLHASGNIILIQDADLELDPKDYPRLLSPILEGKAKITYGSRFQPNNPYFYLTHYFGVKFLSRLTNLFYGSKLTDVYCGYKAFRSDVLKNLKLESKRFEIEEELTIKALKKGYQILEVPIHYYPRSFKEGKKIKWHNGLKAIWLIIKYKFVS